MKSDPYIQRLIIQPKNKGQAPQAGWTVQITFSRFFNDRWFGGQRGSRKEARAFRNSVVAGLKAAGVQMTTNGHFKRKPTRTKGATTKT